MKRAKVHLADTGKEIPRRVHSPWLRELEPPNGAKLSIERTDQTLVMPERDLSENNGTISTENIEHARPIGTLVSLKLYVEPMLLAAVVLIGLAIRLYNLGSFPDTLLADEADYGQNSLRIADGLTPNNGFFGFDWTPQPAYSAYLMSAFIKVFGFTTTTIRLPSAAISALALIPFYLLLRRQFSVGASLLTTVLLATNVWYLNFSRSGWNNVHICFYMLMAMFFLMLGLDAVRTKPARKWLTWSYFVGAGFFCALGLYGYFSGRAIILAMIAFSPLALWFYRRYWKQVVLGYLIIISTAGVAFAPMGVYALQNWDYFNGRSKVVALTNSPSFASDPFGTLWSQVAINVRAPWDGSVNNTPQYSPLLEPQLETVTGVLVLIGMVLSLLLPFLRKRPENWLWWLMLLVAWGSTQILTVGTPNGARGIAYMPTFLYFAAAAIDLPIRAASRLPRVVQWLPVTAAAIILLAVGYGNLTHYVQWQSDPRTRQARYMYITSYEFPEWAAEITERARTGKGTINVGQWRNAHPIPDPSHPAPASSPPEPAKATPVAP